MECDESGFLQGEGIWFRRVYEVQEINQRSEVGFKSNTKSPIYFMVVADHQQSERVRRFPGKADTVIANAPSTTDRNSSVTVQ